MEIKDKVILKTLETEAIEEHKNMQSSVNKVRNNILDRIGKNSQGLLISGIVGSVFWIAAFVGFAFLLPPNPIVIGIYGTVMLVLMILAIVDNSINLKHYGRIQRHLDNSDNLLNRLRDGQNTIDTKYNEFMESEKNGWNLNINKADSITEELKRVETTLANMAELDDGAIKSAKNVFFFIASGVIELFGGYLFFGAASSIVNTIFSGNVSESFLGGVCDVALIIALAGQEFITYLIWKLNGYKVTNTAMFVFIAGPFVFLLLMIVGALIWGLVSIAIKVLMYVLAFAILIACCVGCSSSHSD
ncbi:MAG: hypothetical protein ACI4JS_06470 [Oscillospiraceae bacterium]